MTISTKESTLTLSSWPWGREGGRRCCPPPGQGPRPRHPRGGRRCPGIQSALGWCDYRFHWDLIKIQRRLNKTPSIYWKFYAVHSQLFQYFHAKIKTLACHENVRGLGGLSKLRALYPVYWIDYELYVHCTNVQCT